MNGRKSAAMLRCCTIFKEEDGRRARRDQLESISVLTLSFVDVYLRSIFVHGLPQSRPSLHGQFEMDLIDIRFLNLKQYQYILTIIDVFSKYAFIIPLKNIGIR